MPVWSLASCLPVSEDCVSLNYKERSHQQVEREGPRSLELRFQDIRSEIDAFKGFTCPNGLEFSEGNGKHGVELQIYCYSPGLTFAVHTMVSLI